MGCWDWYFVHGSWLTDFEHRHCSSSPVFLIFEARGAEERTLVRNVKVLKTGHCAFVTRLFGISRSGEEQRRGEDIGRCYGDFIRMRMDFMGYGYKY